MSRRNKIWSTSEDEFLSQHWGKMNFGELSEWLDRSDHAIHSRALDLKLGPSKDGAGLLNAAQLSKAMGVDLHAVTDYWIPKCGLKAERRITKKITAFCLINLANFWAWAEMNQDKFNATRVRMNALGPEPEWMSTKRASDALLPSRSKRIFSPEEDAQLLQLSGKGFNYIEIGKMMGRTQSSINHRATRIRKELKKKE